MKTDNDTAVREAIAELESVKKAMADSEESIEEAEDEFYGGHGGYTCTFDHMLSHRTARMLSILEQHRDHPLVFRWLSHNLDSRSRVALDIVIQTLDNILYGTVPVVTSGDMEHDAIGRLGTMNYYRDWPRLLDDTYRDKFIEVLHEKYRGEWGWKFLADVEELLGR